MPLTPFHLPNSFGVLNSKRNDSIESLFSIASFELLINTVMIAGKGAIPLQGLRLIMKKTSKYFKALTFQPFD